MSDVLKFPTGQPDIEVRSMTADDDAAVWQAYQESEPDLLIWNPPLADSGYKSEKDVSETRELYAQSADAGEPYPGLFAGSWYQGRFAGLIEAAADDDGAVMLRLWTRRGLTGRGIASTGALAVARQLFDDYASIGAKVCVGNVASLKALTKAGFHYHRTDVAFDYLYYRPAVTIDRAYQTDMNQLAAFALHYNQPKPDTARPRPGSLSWAIGKMAEETPEAPKLDAGSRIWIARNVYGAILGTIRVTKSGKSLAAAEISDFYVSEDHRGQGIGKDLWAAASKDPFCQSLADFKAVIAKNDQASRGFFSDLGFVPSETSHLKSLTTMRKYPDVPII